MISFVKKGEKGFILLVTVTILMGLLAIISALVRTTKASSSSFDENLATTQAELAENNVKNIVKLMTRLSNPAEMSPLQRQWVLPGSRSIPLRIQLDGDFSNATEALIVKDIKPWFMALAGPYDESGQRMVLSTDKTSIEDITASGITNTIGMDFSTGSKYVIVEDELILLGTGGRGVAGIKRPHSSGSQVYAVSNTLTQMGVLKMGHEWCKISSVAPGTRTITVLPRPSYGSPPHDPTLDEVIEFYPFFPGLLSGDTYSGISIDMSNEQSRLNLNGLPRTALNTLLGGTLGGTIYTSLGAENHPMMSMYEAMTFANDYLAIQDLSDILTVYSEPTFYNLSTIKMAGTQVSSGRIKINAANTFNTTVAETTTDGLLPLHALNVNEASTKTLEEAFTMMGITNALASATNIAFHRSGNIAGYNISGANISYYDDANDPFDGSTDQYDSTTYYFSSAAEEFRFFLSRNVDFVDDADREIIMAHVYGESIALSNLTSVGPRLCFEAGDVWRASSRILIGNRQKPLISKKSEIVFKPVPNIGGNITLSSQMGWNDKNSTFYAVTQRQPRVTNVAGSTIDIEESSNVFGSNIIGPFAYGKSGTFNSSFSINSYNTGAATNFTTLTYSAAAPTQTNDLTTIDFGIRPVSEQNDLSTTVITLGADLNTGANTLTMTAAPETGSGNWRNQYLKIYDASATPSTTYHKITDLGPNTLIFDPVYSNNQMLSGNSGMFSIISNYKDGFYDATVGPGASIVDYSGTTGLVNGPFYETTIVKEGSNFTNVTWKDTATDGIGGPRVTCTYYNGSSWNILTHPGGAISVPNALRLRFIFDQTVTNGIIPHLYEAKITFNMLENAPRRITYMNK